MSTEQLTDQLLALPLEERVILGQTLWESIHDGLIAENADQEREAIAQARQRDSDLTSGTVSARSHAQVMETARRALGCK